jgi:predicted nucleotidyltransferase
VARWPEMAPSRTTALRFAAAYRQEAAKRQEVEAARARRVLERLPALARRLREEHGAGVVGYFGSLVTGRLHERSDVDLYVDRVRRGGYFQAVDLCWTALELPVDLVELDKAPASLAARIAEDGVVIDG